MPIPKPKEPLASPFELSRRGRPEMLQFPASNTVALLRLLRRWRTSRLALRMILLVGSGKEFDNPAQNLKLCGPPAAGGASRDEIAP